MCIRDRFGFRDARERELFRTFVKINGVGPKLALAIISSLDPGTLSIAVENNEVGVLTKVPGVGKKTAERLMVELKSKLQSLLPEALVDQGQTLGATQQAVGQDAQDALVALGYKPLQAQQMISQLQQSSEWSQPLTTEQLVSAALRNAARRGVDL